MPILWCIAALFLAYGATCAALPAKVRDLQLWMLDRTGISRINPFQQWIETDGFISYLRAVGIGLTIFALFVIYVLSTNEVAAVR